ncbi:MAG: YdcF family protein [Candidatus Latescibacteria bacterium]|nr:YdcF family protein [Candidatus Latescibacterota bacterium]
MILKHLIEGLAFSPLIVVVVFCLALIFRLKAGGLRTAYHIGLGGLAFILVLTSYAFVEMVSAPLISWVPKNTNEKADAVVALGSDATPFGAPTGGSSERAFVGAQLFLSGRAPFLVMTGASGRDSLGGARAMRIIARGLDVPDSCIVLAPGFNTYHEGLSAKPRLISDHAQKILLVTHAYHIPRAAAVFRKQGFTVIPHAVPFSRLNWTDGFAWSNIGRLQGVCHEYAGLLVYRMRGWIDWPHL